MAPCTKPARVAASALLAYLTLWLVAELVVRERPDVLRPIMVDEGWSW